ncbi:cytochrome b/b6 domain-containing protein [Methyloligella sp. GL2]|uniref:cytochrome b/b6 domain-containing protein n=2 Tax=unclassified Methyloligella TaxID=2625955 RepID=UPI001FED8EB2|nr:cytochrome b/b6 domain-containing protein [Methyloligella sp. GL2]
MAREVIYRHAGTVRLTHWINVLCLLVLLMSGLQIFNAHPALYFGSTSDFADPAVAMTYERDGPDGPIGVTDLFGTRFDTTGWLGGGYEADGEFQRYGFPWSITLPGFRSLAKGRSWHFFFAWAFVINGLIYLGYTLLSGHLRRDLAPDRGQLKGIWQSIKDHALFRFDHGEEAKRYNVLQKLSYLIVIFILLPLMLATGLTMSPGMDAAFPWLLDIFGGRQSARTIHFISASLIVLFVLVHVFMVLVTGVWNNLRSMITGRFVIKTEEAEG